MKNNFNNGKSDFLTHGSANILIGLTLAYECLTRDKFPSKKVAFISSNMCWSVWKIIYDAIKG